MLAFDLEQGTIYTLSKPVQAAISNKIVTKGITDAEFLKTLRNNLFLVLYLELTQ